MESTEFNKACWANEHDNFRKVIAAAVEDNLDWAPDPKARSARRLIGHLIGHVQDVIELANDGVIHHRNEVEFDSLQDALETFDAAYREMQDALGKLDTAGWQKPADFFVGESVIAHAPVEQLAWLMLFDSIHHRGQLTVHLRPTGGRVPSLYGPSADDMEMAGH